MPYVAGSDVSAKQAEEKAKETEKTSQQKSMLHHSKGKAKPNVINVKKK